MLESFIVHGRPFQPSLMSVIMPSGVEHPKGALHGKFWAYLQTNLVRPATDMHSSLLNISKLQP